MFFPSVSRISSRIQQLAITQRATERLKLLSFLFYGTRCSNLKENSRVPRFFFSLKSICSSAQAHWGSSEKASWPREGIWTKTVVFWQPGCKKNQKKKTALLRSIMQAGHKERVDIFIRHFLRQTTQQKFSFDRGERRNKKKAQNADLTLPLHKWSESLKGDFHATLTSDENGSWLHSRNSILGNFRHALRDDLGQRPHRRINLILVCIVVALYGNVACVQACHRFCCKVYSSFKLS